LFFSKSVVQLTRENTQKQRREMSKVEKVETSVWDIVNAPPPEAVGVANLIRLASNYDYPTDKDEPQENPYAVYLDLIGYNKEIYGANLWANYELDFVALSEIAKALEEYAVRPHAVLDFIEKVDEADRKALDEIRD
jgi:hypothetical protein